MWRIAWRCAKILADKQGARETRTPAVAATPPDLLWRDLRPILDEEINRLPAKYRAPFLLCYVDGKTNVEAALELGCPKGTVLSRLAWARERLRDRLTRRGLTLSAGLLAAALSTRSAEAAIPAALVGYTLKAALLVAAGMPVAEAASGSVAALTKGALQTMLWSKINLVAGCVLAVSVLGIGGALALQGGGTKPGSGQQTTAATVPVDPPQKADTPPKPDKSNAPKPEEKRYEFEAPSSPGRKCSSGTATFRACRLPGLPNRWERSRSSHPRARNSP